MSEERLAGRVTNVEVVTVKTDGTACKRPYRKVTLDDEMTYQYFEGAEFQEGDTITYRLKDDSGGRYKPKIVSVNVVPAGETPLERKPTVAKLPADLKADVIKVLEADKVDWKVEVMHVINEMSGLVNEDGALAVVARRHGIVPEQRTVVTPARGKSGAETFVATSVVPVREPRVFTAIFLNSGEVIRVGEKRADADASPLVNSIHPDPEGYNHYRVRYSNGEEDNFFPGGIQRVRDAPKEVR